MAQPAEKPTSTRVVTGKCRASYVKIAEPDEKGFYGLTCLIPKSDKETLGKIKAAQEAAAIQKWPSKRPAKLNFTLHDGDGERPSDGEPYGPECKGHMVINVKSKDRPGIVDKSGTEMLDPRPFDSGDYVRVSMNFRGFDVDGNKGVTAYLNNIQFLHRGEPLGGRVSAESEFGEWDDGDEESAW